MDNKLIVTAAPHITSVDSTQKIMQRVCIALVPTLIASVIIFGINSLILTAVTVAACVIFEYLYCKLVGREVAISDFSAVVTGMLLAFNLPATLPWWMAVVGAFIAIVIVKQLFGGLGYNFANPAIVGRIALAMGFASRMSTYGFPADATSTATPLASSEGIDYVTLLLGNHGGVLGETCALTLLLGGLYLIWKKLIDWRIPVFYLATVAVITGIYGAVMGYPSTFPLYHLFAGGLMIGAFFMATDWVTSPITKKGKIIYAIGLGLLTSLIRLRGSYTEGVCYSILMMNMVTPMIDRFVRNVSFGGGQKK